MAGSGHTPQVDARVTAGRHASESPFPLHEMLQQQGQQNLPPPPPQGNVDTLNLSNVLHFLQSEWRRYERDRNEWEIERAEMRVC